MKLNKGQWEQVRDYYLRENVMNAAGLAQKQIEAAEALELINGGTADEVESRLVERCFGFVERAVRAAGDNAAPELVALHNDIVEWDRQGQPPHFTTEAKWDEAHCR